VVISSHWVLCLIYTALEAVNALIIKTACYIHCFLLSKSSRWTLTPP